MVPPDGRSGAQKAQYQNGEFVFHHDIFGVILEPFGVSAGFDSLLKPGKEGLHGVQEAVPVGEKGGEQTGPKSQGQEKGDKSPFKGGKNCFVDFFSDAIQLVPTVLAPKPGVRQAAPWMESPITIKPTTEVSLVQKKNETEHHPRQRYRGRRTRR